MKVTNGKGYLKRIGASRGKWVVRSEATVFTDRATADWWAERFRGWVVDE